MLVHRQTLPRMIERGVAQTLSFDVRDSAGSQQTATVATVALNAGSKVVLAATAATSLGPPASYSLLAATTTSEALSDTWQEVWALTIGSTVYTFRQAAYLVRHVLYPVITDTDLTDTDHVLAELRPTDITSYATFRESAFDKIQRMLIGKGRRPELVLDSWALFDAHVALTRYYIYRDMATKIGDGRYSELRDGALREFKDAWPAKFHYDAALSGTVDTRVQQSAEPTMVFTAGPLNRVVRL